MFTKSAYVQLTCLLLVLFIITSCGSKPEQDQSADEINTKIEQLNSINKKLLNEYQINIGALESDHLGVFSVKLNELNRNTCLDGSALLESYIDLGKQVIAMDFESQNIQMNDSYKLKQLIENAKAVLTKTRCRSKLEQLALDKKKENQEIFEMLLDDLLENSFMDISIDFNDMSIILKFQDEAIDSKQSLHKSIVFLEYFILNTKDLEGLKDTQVNILDLTTSLLDEFKDRMKVYRLQELMDDLVFSLSTEDLNDEERAREIETNARYVKAFLEVNASALKTYNETEQALDKKRNALKVVFETLNLFLEKAKTSPIDGSPIEEIRDDLLEIDPLLEEVEIVEELIPVQ